MFLREWKYNPGVESKASLESTGTMDTIPSPSTYVKLLKSQGLILANLNQWRLYRIAGMNEKEKLWLDTDVLNFSVVEVWRKTFSDGLDREVIKSETITDTSIAIIFKETTQSGTQTIKLQVFRISDS